MKQSLLRLNWPKGVCHSPSQFREALAKTDLPSSFFHYGTEIEAWDKKRELVDGKLVTTEKTRVVRSFEQPIPLNGRPPVRVIGGKSWVGVIADPGAEDLLMPHVGTILTVATKLAGQPVKVEMEQREFGITYTEHPIKYMLRELVLKRRGDRAWKSEIEPLVADRIFGGVSGGSHFGIDGTCALFGFEPPVREMLEIKVFPLKNIGLKMQSANGQSNEYMSLIDAEVWMNASLEGIWQVGNLTARGYGRLIKPFGASQ